MVLFICFKREGLALLFLTGMSYYYYHWNYFNYVILSVDGIHWYNEEVIIPLSGKYYDRYGQVVPSFQVYTLIIYYYVLIIIIQL